jgi:hypothetical protein
LVDLCWIAVPPPPQRYGVWLAYLNQMQLSCNKCFLILSSMLSWASIRRTGHSYTVGVISHSCGFDAKFSWFQGQTLLVSWFWCLKSQGLKVCHAITIAAVIQMAMRPIIKCLTFYNIKKVFCTIIISFKWLHIIYHNYVELYFQGKCFFATNINEWICITPQIFRLG